MSAQPLCKSAELTDEKPLGVDDGRRELILVRTPHAVIAYENRCPHRGTTLDWAKGRFLSGDGAYLQCATHAALFRMEDGVCISGPCLGDALTQVRVREERGALYLEEDS